MEPMDMDIGPKITRESVVQGANHLDVYSLPRNTVIILGRHGWLPHLERDGAILAWAGHASDHLAALKAAF